MQYDAITLDTNLFAHNGYDLEGGMLRQLEQFREGSAMLVLSEIVVREVHKYLKLEAKGARDKLGQVIKEARETGLLAGADLEALDRSFRAALPPEEAARNRLNRFAEATNLAVVAGHDVDGKELIRRYFAPAPPFEGSGKKKNEFPDAIALITLEAWAKKHGRHILAISKDQGWVAYARGSDFIDVDDDLGVALQKFQKDAEQAKAHIAIILKAIDSAGAPDLRDEIIAQLAQATEELTVYAEASASTEWEVDNGVALQFANVEFIRLADDYDFSVVQVGKSSITAKVKLEIQAAAEAEISFSVYDSIDKDQVPIGTTIAKTRVDFEAFALVVFEGDFEDIDSVSCKSIEIVETNAVANFGHIEPDWSGDYDDDQWRTK